MKFSVLCVVLDVLVEFHFAFAEKDKSSSVPHLSPIAFTSNSDLPSYNEGLAIIPPSNQPSLMESIVPKLDYDRPRTGSDSYSCRPRGSSWSQLMRPRSSSHEHRPKGAPLRGVKVNSGSRESVQSASSDYIDMHIKSKDKSSTAYMEMTGGDSHHPSASHSRAGGHLQSKPVRKGSLGTPHKRKNLKGAKHGMKNSSPDNNELGTGAFSGGNVDLDDSMYSNSSNLLMCGRRLSQPHSLYEPFPEISASSEEELSMRSGASSFSSSKSTSSSRSSLARAEDIRRAAQQSYKLPPTSHPPSGLMGESYVECQQSVGYRVPNLSATMLGKPERVTSYISEETAADTTTSANGERTPFSQPDDYAQMMAPLERRSSKSSLASSTSRASNMTSEAPLDSYMEMSGSTHLPVTPNLKSRNSSKPEVRISSSPASDSYMSMDSGSYCQPTVNNTGTADRPADSYVDMVPVANQVASTVMDYKPISVPGKNDHKLPGAPKATTATANMQLPVNLAETSTSNTAKIDDPYLVMESQNPVKSHSELAFNDPYMAMAPAANFKPLPDISLVPIASESDTISSSDIQSQVFEGAGYAGGGSSSESNGTLAEDTYPVFIPPLNVRIHEPDQPHRKVMPIFNAMHTKLFIFTQLRFHFITIYLSTVLQIQPPICYVRQDSKDVLPTSHTLQTTCYIRADSTVSQQSDMQDHRLSPCSQINIIDELANQSEPAAGVPAEIATQKQVRFL